MSASMLNLSALAAPAQPGAAGKAGAAAQGPLAGFEALMAAFFGAQGAGEAAQLFAPQAAQGMAGAAVVTPAADGKPADAKAGDDAAEAPKSDEASKTADAAATTGDNLALLAALVVPAPAQPIVQAVIEAAFGGGQAPAADGGKTPAAQPQPAAGAGDPEALFDAKAAADAGLALPDAAQPAVPNGQAKAAAAPQAAVPQPAAAPAAPPPAPVVQAAAQPTVAAPEVALAPPPVLAAEAAPVQPAPAPVKEKSGARSDRADAARPAAGRPEAFAAAGAPERPGAAAAAPTDSARIELAAAGDHAEATAVLEPDVAAAHDADQPAQPAQSTAASASAPAQAQAQAPIVRGSPETVANMAAQIVKKLDARSTRFDLELDPAGLGRVDVRVEINAHGRLSAAMSFDNPQAAAELKSRSAELTKALEQAGFDMSGGMSFDVAGDQGRPGQGFAGQAGQERDANPGFRGRAFQAALDTAGEADAAARPLNLRRGVSAGLDVRI